jgi:cobaltochelatase CobT
VVNLPNTAPFELFLGYFRSTEVTNNIVENGKPMANKLRIKLQTRSRGRYEYGQKRGKLHGGSLHRVLQDSPVSERVFRQHKVVDTLDTAVMVLVDCSGSMSGEKFEMACVGAGSVVEALRPLHIECSVLGFTNNAVDGSDDPVIFNFKKYGEQITTSELVSRFNIASGYLWENTDGDAIVYAYHQLMQRKEKRKVLLVLSDGSPSGRGKAGDIVAYTKLVTDTIYNSNTVDMYGIGIMDSDVKKYYKKNVVVYKLSELSYNMLSIIDRSLT